MASKYTSEADIKQFADSAKLGNFLSLSPTFEDYGRRMSKRANERLDTATQRKLDREDTAEKRRLDREDESNKYRAPVSIGQGLLYDPSTGETLTSEEYEQSLQAAHKRKMQGQAAKDAEAFRRALIGEGGGASTPAGVIPPKTLENMPAGEQKSFREATIAVQKLPAIMQLVKDNADSFGALEDLTAYFPDWMPQAGTEATKNIQNQRRSPEVLKARAAVIEQASSIIKALSGAAVSPAEEKRLLGFLPSPNDTAEIILSKLEQAKSTAQTTLDSFEQYGPLSADEPPIEQTPTLPGVVAPEAPALAGVVAPEAPAAPSPQGQAGPPTSQPVYLPKAGKWVQEIDGQLVPVPAPNQSSGRQKRGRY